MTTRYCKLPGSTEYVTWDNLHNEQGYSEIPTDSILWKQISDWGTDAGSGYSVPTETFAGSSLFMSGITGWHDLNWFAENGLFPGNSEIIELSHPTYGTSNVAMIEFSDDDTRFLIQKDLAPGWITESEYTERGWFLPQDYEIVFLNGITGNVLFGAENISPVAFEQTGYFAVEDGDDVIFIEEIRPPLVNNDAGAVATYPNHADFASNSIQEGRVWGTNSWIVSTYDSTKTYAAISWHAENSFDGFYGIEISDYNGHLGITNVLPFTITRYIESVFATCDSLDVSVVTVYDANNAEYNAFKYVAGNRTFYYVLDFVQSNWVTDLSGIGYSATPNISNTFLLAVSLDANNEPEADVFEESGWYWWSRVMNDATKNALDSEGLWLDSGYPFGSAKYSSGGKTLVLIGVFTDADGLSMAPGWNKAFDLMNSSGTAALRTPGFGYPTAVKTYRVKIVQ